MNEQYILNQTYITKKGKGLPSIVLHGGPGLEHSYLLEHLKFLEQERELIFYDQLGCGNSTININSISLENCVKQLQIIIENINSNSFGIISHSWGTLLALNLLAECKLNKNLVEFISISPIPLSDLQLQKSFSTLFLRMPNSLQEEIKIFLEENTSEAGLKIMKSILPFYIAKENNSINLNFKSYNVEVNKLISNSIKGYDYHKVIKLLPRNSHIIVGDKDFFWQENSFPKEFFDIHIIKNAGHFPFAERPFAFQELFKNYIIKDL